MKYTYVYKTSDGVRHEAVMNAPSREVVFETLRGKGIKAIKVVAADGAKANGEIRGVRKRVVALIVLIAAVVVGVASFFFGESATETSQKANNERSPRHQIYGDPAIMADFEKGNFGTTFSHQADRMLAWFAQPGRLMCPSGTDPRDLADAFAECWGEAADTLCPFSADDSREVVELKQIVNGMHDEIGQYLANGNGTPQSYWRRLIERTQQEVRIYERICRELQGERNEAVIDEKNEALRRLGLRTIIGGKDEL